MGELFWTGVSMAVRRKEAKGGREGQIIIIHSIRCRTRREARQQVHRKVNTRQSDGGNPRLQGAAWRNEGGVRVGGRRRRCEEICAEVARTKEKAGNGTNIPGMVEVMPPEPTQLYK